VWDSENRRNRDKLAAIPKRHGRRFREQVHYRHAQPHKRRDKSIGAVDMSIKKLQDGMATERDD
jgi:hypothetical protein